MLGITTTLAALVLLAVTFIARVRHHAWWVRACEFPRVQISCLILVVMLLGLFANGPLRWLTLAICALSLAVQIWNILPWTPLSKAQMQSADEVDDQRCVTIIIANVLTPNHNSAKLIEQILYRKPDVMLTLESDDWWQQRLDAALGDEWPNSVKIPLDNLYGMHLYSRLPLTNVEVSHLIQDDIPSIHATLHLRSGDRIALHAVHPRPPAPAESDESTWRDAELLLVGQHIRDKGGPTLLIGDLNDVAWSRTTRLFAEVSGMLDPRRGRGMFSTFHAGHLMLRWPLDHIFASEHFTLGYIERLEKFGSDHFPILATLCYTPEREAEQEKPEAEDDQQEVAGEIIDEAKERAKRGEDPH